MRKVVKEPEKEHIMKLTLCMAHDEKDDKLRESAVKLLNECAPDMGQQLCEYFIVHEICSLGYDQKANVRQTVARNLLPKIRSAIGFIVFIEILIKVNKVN